MTNFRDVYLEMLNSIRKNAYLLDSKTDEQGRTTDHYVFRSIHYHIIESDFKTILIVDNCFSYDFSCDVLLML